VSVPTTGTTENQLDDIKEVVLDVRTEKTRRPVS
jgi:hypothetical protein